MSDRQIKENFNKAYVRAAQYTQPVVLPTKVFTTYSNPTVYTIKTGDYFDEPQVQTSTNTTYNTETTPINNSTYKTTTTTTTYTTKTRTSDPLYDYTRMDLKA